DFFFFQAEDGIRDRNVTGVQTCALPILIFFPPLAPGLVVTDVGGLAPVTSTCERSNTSLRKSAIHCNNSTSRSFGEVTLRPAFGNGSWIAFAAARYFEPGNRRLSRTCLE